VEFCNTLCLNINVEKTDFRVLRRPTELRPLRVSNLTSGERKHLQSEKDLLQLKVEENFKYLGVEMSLQLSWRNQQVKMEQQIAEWKRVVRQENLDAYATATSAIQFLIPK